MLSFFESQLQALSVHHVGNKILDEGCRFTKELIDVSDEACNRLLMNYYLSVFTEKNTLFSFCFASDDLVKQICDKVFASHTFLADTAACFGAALYDRMSHPNIPARDLHVIKLSKVQHEGELQEAIGLFAARDSVRTISVTYQGAPGVELYQGSEIPEYAALILNTSQGYRVFIACQNNKTASCWKDDFLNLEVYQDEAAHTSAACAAMSNFVSQGLDEEFDVSACQKGELLTTAKTYFKERESFDLDEFCAEVLQHEEVQNSFKRFIDLRKEELGIEFPEQFDIDGRVASKATRAFKSVLALDKNFHVYVHGSSQLIDRGHDEDKGLNYIKIYYKEER